MWRPHVRSERGRPAQLDTARIVETALALADRGGVAALTLPQVARALGYTTMSLYRHVGARDEFLQRVQDAAIGPPPGIDTAADAWREGLTRWALAQRAVFQRRAWLARLPISGPPLGPNQVGWMEAALRALGGTGLQWSEKLGVLLLVSGYVRQSAMLEEDLKAGERGSGASPGARRYGRVLAQLVDPVRFPEMSQLLASGTFDSPGSDEYEDADFAFGLERILDGVGAVVNRRRKGRRKRR